MPTYTTDFVALATGAGANVAAQSDYLAAGYLSTGFASGIAPSAGFNKALRQATFVTAGLTQWMATAQAANVSDDGNLSNFVTLLTAALPSKLTVNAWTLAQTFNAGFTVSGAKANFAASVAGYASLNVPQGAAPTAPANGDVWLTSTGVFARVNGATQQFANINGANTWSAAQTFSGGLSGTLTGNVSGSAGSCTGNSATASKLAAAQSISMTGDVSWSVNFDGSGAVSASGAIQAGAVTAAKMAGGAAVGNLGYTPLRPSNNLSDLSSISAAIANLGFSSNISANGHIMLPGGLIIAWMTSGSIPSLGIQNVFFDQAFPNACFGAVATCLNANTGTQGRDAVTAIATDHVTVFNGGATSSTFFVIGVGH